MEYDVEWTPREVDVELTPSSGRGRVGSVGSDLVKR